MSREGKMTSPCLSRFGLLDRQLSTSKSDWTAWTWVTTTVLVHLVLSIVHGAADVQPQVQMSGPANLFVLVVILAGPPIGLALAWSAERIAAWIIAITMAGSLL